MRRNEPPDSRVGAVEARGLTRWRIRLPVLLGLIICIAPANQAMAQAEVQTPGVAPAVVPYSVPPPDPGYDGVAAAAYADRWALGANPAYPFFGGAGEGDCTNFVSQAMAAGGWTMTGNAIQTDDTFWHFIRTSPTGGIYTSTWAAADNLWRYQTVTPYSVFEGKWGPGAAAYNAPYTPGPVVTGDVILYNWFNDDNSSTAKVHWSIQTGIGWSQNGQPPLNIYGNFVDEHTSNRYHVFWSLWPFNAYKATTTYRFWHLT